MSKEPAPPLLATAEPPLPKDASNQALTTQTSQPGNGKSKSEAAPQSTEQQSTDIRKDITILPTNSKGLHTVFIHKLYNMLEDEELKHLIWWSPSCESFLITPGEEFSKALSQYFKHTNVASFIRQLNMYSFHKVSDGSNTANSDSEIPIWEFKHSSGSFRKGDINGLKSIKRRSSKHSQRSIDNNGTSNTVSQQLQADSGSEYEMAERPFPHPDLPAANAPETVTNSATPIDPALNMRLAELGHNLAALRHEHARLQLRYDTAVEDIRKTNLDMVYLIDLVQKLSGSSRNGNKDSNQISPQQSDQHIGTIDERINSPGLKSNANDKSTLAEVESDIANFRASVIQRAASKEFDQFPVSFAPSYQVNQQISRSSVTSQPNQSQQPLPIRTQSRNQPQVHGNSHSPCDQSGPVPYPYPYPNSSNQIHIKKPQVVRDPFGNDSRKSSTSSRPRNMSVLYDPLQPVPNSTIQSQADSSSMKRGSLSGPTTTTNIDTNTTSPMLAQNSYFPEYGIHHSQAATPGVQYSVPSQNPAMNKYPPPPPHHQQHIQYHQQHYVDSQQFPMTRDQRSESYPEIMSSAQQASKGASQESLTHKARSNSTDFYSQGSNRPYYSNLPRRLPRAESEESTTSNSQLARTQNDGRPLSSSGLLNNTVPRPSVSTSSSDFSSNEGIGIPKSQVGIAHPDYYSGDSNSSVQGQQSLQGSNSGVYALLNPERRESVSHSTNKRQRK